MSDKPLFAAIEAGGTKFVCALMNEDAQVLAHARIPTTLPENTFAAVHAFFDEAQDAHGSVSSLGVASFGPVNIDQSSPDYGIILATPKPYWEGAAILSNISRALNVPGKIDTDVNAAALAEWRQGAGIGAKSVAYVTVGTGIGVGIVADGQTYPSRAHGEMGHMRVPRAEGDTLPFSWGLP